MSGSDAFTAVSTVLDHTTRRRPTAFQRLASGLSIPHQPSRPDNDEFKLPKRLSLATVLLSNTLYQITFFIIVSSSDLYTNYLGGTSTFSGLVIGIPTAITGIALIPFIKLDQGQYRKPMYIGISVAIIGNIFYALAYHVHNIYFILLGRLICGIAFTNFLYNKRYCSDARIVGIRRRTQLAGLLVVGQGLGFSAGPFLGGLLYKVGFSNDIFNGYTSPGWIMALVWFIFLLISVFTLEDVPPLHAAQGDINAVIELRDHHPECEQNPPTAQDSSSDDRLSQTVFRMTSTQWGVVACMSWQSFTCFFILGGWEANIPVYTGSTHPFYYSPFAAGNFIALGGLASFPLLFLNVIVARRIQDRRILATGSGLGFTGLVIMLAMLARRTVNVGSFFICWFLIALGFNLSSTVTTSLLSKQVPPEWNLRMALIIEYSSFVGRVLGAVWGGSGVRVGMINYVLVQIAVVVIGAIMYLTLWRRLKTKTGLFLAWHRGTSARLYKPSQPCGGNILSISSSKTYTHKLITINRL